MFYSFRLAVFALLFLTAGVSAQIPMAVKEEPKVRELTRTMSGMMPYTGIVGKIDAGNMTLVETDSRGELKEHTFAPIDLLRKGEYIPNVWGSYAYRWKDVKAGDTVSVEVLWDPDEKVMYCMQIKIERRPNDKLPKSQKPKEDSYFAARSIYNDIDNGLDVSDEELKKAFPPEFKVDRKTGEKTPVKPGVVYLRYMDKLDAIRAKKAKELKAPSPEKK